MRRRDFITLLGGSAAAWPLAARAQRPKGLVIGYLNSISNNAKELAAFRQGLADLGFIEGQNVALLYRYADGQYERLPALAADLVAQQVDVIVTLPSSPAALAAKQATSTIPIAFMLGADPIRLGLVSSYNQPGANVTGINIAFAEFPKVGGFIAYGPNLAAMFRRVGNYVGKILHGAKPDDLPIQRPEKFDIVINLKTATAIGVEVPAHLQQLADEIIE
jgi:ABC-type uncharacterized transport system substrate-binding protein